MIVALLLLATAAPDPAPSEVERVFQHLERAERTLAARDLSHLPPEVRARRARLIETLRTYREAGRFPENDDSWTMRPTFVDDRGTRCAMAELIGSTGETELVQKVATRRNHAFIRELVDDPELVRWLDHHGLTAAEAARIQPSYCRVRGDTVCIDGTTGVAMAQPVDGDSTEVVIREAHGQTGTDAVGTTFDVESWYWERLQPSRGFVVLYREGQRQAYLPLDREGVRSPGDIQCGSAPRVPMEALPSLLLDPVVDCRDELALMDPRFAGSICDGPAACPDARRPDPFEPWPSAKAKDDAPAPVRQVNAEEGAGGCRTPGGQTIAWVLLLLAAPLGLRRRRSGARS